MVELEDKANNMEEITGETIEEGHYKSVISGMIDLETCDVNSVLAPSHISFISVLVLTWAGNDCDYLGRAGREWPETAESVFKSEPELRSGNNKNWCDLVTGA